jgi:predicted Zn-dependent protease
MVYDLEKTFPYASALVLETAGERILVQTRQQSAELLDPSRGAVLTAFNGRSFLECATGDLSVEGLRGAAEKLQELGRDQGIFYDGPQIDPGPKMAEYYLIKPETFPEMVSLAEKIGACTALKDDLHRRDDKVVQAVAQYAHVRTRELFINRHKVLYQDLRRTQMVAQVIMREGERSVNLHTGQALIESWVFRMFFLA